MTPSIKLTWSDVGPNSGPAMVFLHGFLGSRLDWADTMNRFSNVRCLAPDLPGHGQSPWDDTVDWDSLITTLNHDVLSRNLSDIVIVGYSMGGRIALEWARTAPGLIRGIILESASPGIETDVERRARAIFDRDIERRLRTMAPIDFIDWWCSLPMFGTLNTHPNYSQLRQMRSQYSSTVMCRAFQTLSVTTRESVWDLMHTLPIWGFITGEHDTKYAAIATRIIDRFPTVLVNILSNCAHNVHFQDIELFANSLSSILEAKRFP